MNKEQNKNSRNIPTLKPFQFDEYLFGGWKAPTGSWYNNFHISRIETYQKHLKLPIPSHRRSVFYFMYVHTGLVVRTKLLNRYEIPPNHFFLLGADATNSIEYVAPETTGFYCHFKPETFHQPYLKTDLLSNFPFFRLISEPLIKVSTPFPFVQLLEKLEKEYQDNHKERFELIALYLMTLLTEIKLANPKADFDLPVKKTAAQLVMRYKEALAEFIYEKTKVADYALHLSITPNHLNKVVKSVTGKSAYQLLAEMRVMEAKVLLKQSGLSIGEIAWQVGKMEQSDFTRFFKSNTQMTPNQYRRLVK